MEFAINGCLPAFLTNNESGIITYSQEKANKGYLGGCNLALKAYRKAHKTEVDWIGICNTDLEFDTNFFEIFPNTSDNICIAPNIRRSHDDTPQNPFMRTRPSRLKQLAMSLISKNYILFYLFVASHKTRTTAICQKENKRTTQIYAPHGSCFFLKKDFFSNGGSIEYPCFMYGEELFIAEQLHQQKQMVHFSRELHIKHDCGMTTSLTPNKKRIEWQMESWRYLLRNFYFR